MSENKLEEYNWYLVGTRGAREKQAIENIRKDLKKNNLDHLVKDLISFNSEGEKDQKLKNYILCNCNLNDELIRFFRRIKLVTGFIMEKGAPSKVSERTVERFLAQMKEISEGKVIITPTISENFDYEFNSDDLVKIISGPFKDYGGKVSNVDKEKKTLKITLTKLNWEIADVPMSACQKIQ